MSDAWTYYDNVFSRAPQYEKEIYNPWGRRDRDPVWSSAFCSCHSRTEHLS